MIEKRLADSVIAAILMVVGVAQVWGGFTMDRLEIRRIHPASIPGLLPIILGIAMFGLALIVFIVSRREQNDGGEAAENFVGSEIRGFAWIVGLAALYALFLVGKVHFWLASAFFVFTFIMIAEWQRLETSSQKLRMSLIGGAIAIIVTGGIAYMFERGFLVRLP